MKMATVGAVLNGEIYNFQELRKQLEDRGHAFRTRSDSEVVAHAYEEWGADCVEHLQGMFALAVYDGEGRGRTSFKSAGVGRSSGGERPRSQRRGHTCFWRAIGWELSRCITTRRARVRQSKVQRPKSKVSPMSRDIGHWTLDIGRILPSLLK